VMSSRHYSQILPYIHHRLDLTEALKEWESVLAKLALDNKRTIAGTFYYAWWDEISVFLAE
jgi:hypothetical protein